MRAPAWTGESLSGFSARPSNGQFHAGACSVPSQATSIVGSATRFNARKGRDRTAFDEKKRGFVSSQQPVRPANIRLRPPRHRVAQRAIALWTVQSLLLVVPVLAALVVSTILFAPMRFWLLPLLIVVGVFGVAYTVVMPQWRYRVHRWETTESAVYTAAGWFRQEWRVAPMSRIQTVDTVRGPLQRMFSLASVTVTTASAAGPLSIEGLDSEVASQLVDQLTTITQATRGDAT